MNIRFMMSFSNGIEWKRIYSVKISEESVDKALIFFENVYHFCSEEDC